MILLVDAHVILWLLSDDARLSDLARRSVRDPENDVLASAASIWELEAKRKAGRLDTPDDLLGALERSDIATLPISGADAIAAARLPLHHKDPFDRMLVAQAQRLDAVLVTRDRAFASYDVKVLTA